MGLSDAGAVQAKFERVSSCEMDYVLMSVSRASFPLTLRTLSQIFV